MIIVVDFVQEDLRVDGRGCEDYRCIEVETDVVSNTSGSARVKLVSILATGGYELLIAASGFLCKSKQFPLKC